MLGRAGIECAAVAAGLRALRNEGVGTRGLGNSYRLKLSGSDAASV
jgi:hypothetical protein